MRLAALAAFVAAAGLAASVIADRATIGRDAEHGAPESAAAYGVASLVKSGDGHYWAEAAVDAGRRATQVRFLVDTGASIVALTETDARRLGLDPRDLDYVARVRTASGAAPAAPVTLRRVSVAGVALDDVEAVVMREGLDHSLLGMSFLGRLSRVEATPGGLILRR